MRSDIAPDVSGIAFDIGAMCDDIVRYRLAICRSSAGTPSDIVRYRYRFHKVASDIGAM